jgi:hypothetical protein
VRKRCVCAGTVGRWSSTSENAGSSLVVYLYLTVMWLDDKLWSAHMQDDYLGLQDFLVWIWCCYIASTTGELIVSDKIMYVYKAN